MAAAVAFQAGRTAAGYALGGSLTLAAFVNVATGFCVPSFLYGLLFGRPRRGSAQAKESEIHP